MYRDTRRFGGGEWLLTVVKGHLTHTFILGNLPFLFPALVFRGVLFPHSMQCSLVLGLQNHALAGSDTNPVSLTALNHPQGSSPHFPLGPLNPNLNPIMCVTWKKEARNGPSHQETGAVWFALPEVTRDLQQVSAVQAGQEACRTLQDE